MTTSEITRRMEDFLRLQDNIVGDEYGQTDLDHACTWLEAFADFIGADIPDISSTPGDE